jgi:hypothetical protein
MSNDYSLSNINKITDPDHTEEYNTIDNSNSHQAIKRNQNVGSLPAIHKLNKPSYSNFGIGGDSSPGSLQPLKGT